MRVKSAVYDIRIPYRLTRCTSRFGSESGVATGLFEAVDNAPSARLKGVSLGGFVAVWRRHRPAFRGGIIGRLGADPGRSGGLLDLLPERRARFQVIHEKRSRREAASRWLDTVAHQHDDLAGHDAPVAMDDGDAEQRPARACCSTCRAISASAMLGYVRASAPQSARRSRRRGRDR